MYPIDFFWRSVARCPSRPAVLLPERVLTYAELGAVVRRRARAIERLDRRPGTPVCVGGINSLDHLIALLATLAAGKVWVPLNPRNGDLELRRIIEFVSPRLLLVDEPLTERLEGVRGQLCQLDRIEDERAYADIGSQPEVPRARPLDATQALKFTGGTTGTPKGVEQPLRAWNTNIVTQIHEIGLTQDDRYLIAAPLTHGTSTYVLPVLAVGGALVLPAEAKVEAMLDAAARNRVTLTFGPPAMISMLATEQRRRPRSISSLRCLIYGGAPMRSEQIASAQEVFGPIVAATFGQTEAPQIAAWLPPGDMSGERLLSAGRATLLTEIQILAADGAPLPPNEQGEIAIRGDLVMTGYHNAPEESAKVLVDGWLRTGDVGVLDEGGYLFVRDRLRDVIITGGFNVFPSDVEAVLGAHPAVADCSVFGVPDSKWGEAVHAAIKPRDKARWDPAPVLQAVRNALGPVKTPKALHLFDELPRSPVGKVLKSAIRDEVAARLDALRGHGGED